MKAMVKCICVFLSIVMLLTTNVFATSQEEQTDMYSSSYFVGYGAYCWKTTSNQFEVWFEVDARNIMDKLGAERIKIQKSSNGTDWLTVMTYSASYYENLLCNNTGSHADCVTYTGASGYYYRAYVTFYAKNSTGIGKAFDYTQPIYLGS